MADSSSSSAGVSVLPVNSFGAHRSQLEKHHLGQEINVPEIAGQIDGIIEKFTALAKIEEQHHEDELPLVKCQITNTTGGPINLEKKGSVQTAIHSDHGASVPAPDVLPIGETKDFTMTVGDVVKYSIKHDDGVAHFHLVYPGDHHHPKLKLSPELRKEDSNHAIEMRKTEKKTHVHVKTDNDTETTWTKGKPKPTKKSCHEHHHHGNQGDFKFNHKSESDYKQNSNKTVLCETSRTEIDHIHVFVAWTIYKTEKIEGIDLDSDISTTKE